MSAYSIATIDHGLKQFVSSVGESNLAAVVMETTTQREPRSDSADHKVESKQKKCLSTRAVRIAAVLVGISLAAVAVLSAYAAGAFDSNPDLPEIMEGEATLTTDDGKGEVFHVMIDYKRKLIQLTSLNDPAASPQLFGRRLMSFEENKTANGTRINATKIVLQDYNAKTKYFIVPEHGNSTTKCIYTNLEGDMIPRHLLKHATLKSESVEGNTTHSLYQVENDTDVDVYRAKGYNGKIYEVYLHLPNGSIHMRSKEKEMNFTDYKHLNCYRYIEENDTIEEAFHRSNDSKLYQESTRSSDPELEKNIQETSSNLTQLLNQMTSFGNESLANQLPMISRRRRRGIGWRGGSLDWWYGNWCGGYQGGYTRYPKPSCNDDCWRTTSYVNSACHVLFIVAVVLGGASLLEIHASVTALLYGESTTRCPVAHPENVDPTPAKSTLYLNTCYPVGFPSGFAFLGSGLDADASGVRVPGFPYTGSALNSRCALSLVQEKFFLNLIGVFT
ncbi:hypothetical protein AWC38_SpisGene5595 [Stylophora pistillata]|uniref:Uncharacterized protein n=1 Tax=Stylophora pistillata TaxID=50429 RepID=A0A2B4SG07_STYPI|nr:hypothetical protein AWC38_SpisGene5595 [Stylophora pistillata]